jgi:DNA-binding NarL/FixJ family response regulator
MNGTQSSMLSRAVARSGIGRGGGRVLVAEDDPVVRAALGELLHDEGFDVVGLAANGAEAVSLTLQVDPDVVISDVGMPVMNGLEATRSIKEQSPDVQVIILSASSDPDHISQAEEAGVYRYLNKGGPVTQIIETIAHARACRATPGKLG